MQTKYAEFLEYDKSDLAEMLEREMYVSEQRHEIILSTEAEVFVWRNRARALEAALQGMLDQFGFEVTHPNGLVHDEIAAIQKAMRVLREEV